MAKKTYFSFVAEADNIALRELLCRLDQRLPARTIEAFDQRRLDLRLGVAADAAAGEVWCDHFGVVHYQLVPGLKELRKRGNGLIAQCRTGLQHQHPRGIARARRPQRDTVGGKFEVKEVGAHALNS